MSNLYRIVIKRLMDIIFAIICFPFFVVLFVIIAPLIFFEDHGPAFYCAPRLGKNGVIFNMYKFRTMKVNSPDLRNEDGTTWNSESDPRVTKIGRFLRKTSLDEIPQILNVLKGDMSLIGPRPDLPDQIQIYKKEHLRKLKILPGITGYSQVKYRNAADIDERFTGDLYYMDHMTLLMDISILLKTVQIVLKRENIYKN